MWSFRYQRPYQRRSVLKGVELLVGERPQGTFSRELFLGDGLDTDRIDADYADGVLTLRLPIAEKAKPCRVFASGPAPAADIAGTYRPDGRITFT